MSHVFQIPDDLYSEVAAYATQRGQTPDALLMALVTGGVELLKRVESTVPTHEVQYVIQPTIRLLRLLARLIVVVTILVGSKDMMSTS
jgi:hypothetical protein